MNASLMLKTHILFHLFIAGPLLHSCNQGQNTGVVAIFPDSVITDVSHRPVWQTNGNIKPHSTISLRGTSITVIEMKIEKNMVR